MTGTFSLSTIEAARSILALDATSQAGLVRNGEISARELVDLSIDRIEACNTKLNAVIHRRFEEALREADSPRQGPFSGVPFLLKDLDVLMQGQPFHAGMACLKKAYCKAPHTSSLVAKFLQAGLIVVGKTNTPELGLHGTTEPKTYGATRNPWHLEYSPGGSSGGSAAAVAAGLVAVAHASDGGGSIRIPASACGLVGLKPSRGRISMAPEHGDYWNGFVSSFVVTRSVRDCAALLDVVSGVEPGDPYTAVPAKDTFLSSAKTKFQQLKIGLMTRSPEGAHACHPECTAAVETVGRQLESLGHHVELSHPGAIDQHHRIFSGFNKVVSSWVAKSIDEWSEILELEIGEGDIESGTLALAERGRSISAAQYLRVVADLQLWSREVASWWTSGFDLLVTPTLSAPPLPLGSRARDVFAIASFTTQFNITGQPAISLPSGTSQTGLPIGVQFVANAHREDQLLQIATALEQCPGIIPRT